MNVRKKNKGLKSALIVAGTIIGAVSIALIIALFPSCESETRKENPNSGINVEVTEEENAITTESNDYEDLNKEELLKVIEEKDEKIAELENEVEELTILAEQTTNAIVPPSVPVNSGSGSTSDDDDTSSTGTSSGNSSSAGSSSGGTSSGNSSSGSNSTGNSSSGNSSTENNPHISDTGL